MSFESDQYDLAGRIHSLYVHPIKSCAGIAVQQE